VEIEGARLPLAADCADWRGGMSDGEDYELLFCASGAVPEQVAGTGVVRIGRVIEGSGCWCVTPEGERVDGSAMGWDHT